MARFYFRIINDIEVPDEQGQELQNLAEAHLKAIQAARDLASHSVRLGRLDLKHQIQVQDDAGTVLLTVTFADAIELSK
ncbi:hypothetical protein CA234_19325 [Sphingomonas sp. ABOLE]|uniref:DUF6894 family protein n=1 Tax=Sphingomonas sp. ABOLE TaxID=1985878 RepID=UPI000F7F27EE|nr:hypothetical protein [Sphingomonas sp. ABOLE]RSV35787.1 hypothetical protein CA234_19325 [Sphingomonas sp. ABOLE]